MTAHWPQTRLSFTNRRGLRRDGCSGSRRRLPPQHCILLPRRSTPARTARMNSQSNTTLTTYGCRSAICGVRLRVVCAVATRRGAGGPVPHFRAGPRGIRPRWIEGGPLRDLLGIPRRRPSTRAPAVGHTPISVLPTRSQRTCSGAGPERQSMPRRVRAILSKVAAMIRQGTLRCVGPFRAASSTFVRWRGWSTVYPMFIVGATQATTRRVNINSLPDGSEATYGAFEDSYGGRMPTPCMTHPTSTGHQELSAYTLNSAVDRY